MNKDRYTLIRDDGGGEEVIVLKNDEFFYSCKEYETDGWVAAIVKDLGADYKEIEGEVSDEEE